MNRTYIGLIGAAVLGALTGCSGGPLEEQELDTQAQLLTGTAYDAMGDYSPNPDVLAARAYSSSCRLIDGNGDERWLVAGGFSAFQPDVGGFDDALPQTLGPNTSATADAYLFNPTLGGGLQWVKTANMGTARAGHQAITIPGSNDTQCLVAGGVNGTPTALATGEIFDITLNGGLGGWVATANNMTVPRIGHKLRQCGDKIIAIAGQNNAAPATFNTAIDVFDVSDAVTPWSKLIDLNVARSFFGVSAKNNSFEQFVITQGINGGTLLDTVETLDVNEECETEEDLAGFDDELTLDVPNVATEAQARWQPEAAPASSAAGELDDFVTWGGSALASGNSSLASSIRFTVTNYATGAYNAVVVGPAMSAARREMVVEPLDTTLTRWGVVGGRNNSADGLSIASSEVYDKVSERFEDLSNAVAVDTLLDRRFAPAATFFSVANAAGDQLFIAGGVDRRNTPPLTTSILSSTEGL